MAKTNITNAAQPQTPPAVAPAVPNSRVELDYLQQLQRDLHAMLTRMTTDMQTEALTPAERRRMQGSGVRRYGFIDKTSDLAADNLQFAPPFFNIETLKNYLRMIETLRSISVTLQQMLRIDDDVLLTVSDEAFQMALGYYNTVREASRRRQPGAQALFRELQPFFQRGRMPSAEPTEPEVERDVKALLHGRKDGKIVIENEREHMSGGKHVVVDETYKERAAWKETEEGRMVNG